MSVSHVTINMFHIGLCYRTKIVNIVTDNKVLPIISMIHVHSMCIPCAFPVHSLCIPCAYHVHSICNMYRIFYERIVLEFPSMFIAHYSSHFHIEFVRVILHRFLHPLFTCFDIFLHSLSN